MHSFILIPLAELLLAYMNEREEKSLAGESGDEMILHVEDSTAAGSLSTFLNSNLKYRKDDRGQEICVVQAGDDEVGVMMGWEREISEHYPASFLPLE